MYLSVQALLLEQDMLGSFGFLSILGLGRKTRSFEHVQVFQSHWYCFAEIWSANLAARLFWCQVQQHAGFVLLKHLFLVDIQVLLALLFYSREN